MKINFSKIYDNDFYIENAVAGNDAVNRIWEPILAENERRWQEMAAVGILF